MGQIQSFEEFISLLLRRRWLIIAVAVIGTLFAAVYAKSRPNTYKTAAVIQVEGAAVQDPNTAPADGGSAATLQIIEQRLTTRENLAAVIERHGLYADMPVSLDRKIQLLRTSVSFQGVDSAAGQVYGQGRTLSAILVYARMGDAELAARVANDFAQGILDQSAANQRSRADQNIVFFQQEADRIGQQIAAVEAEVSAFQAKNASSLPTALAARRDELSSVEGDLRQFEQDKLALQGEAEQINAKQTLRETDRRALDDIAARIAVLDVQITSTRARRDEIEAELAASPDADRALAGYERQLEQLQDQQDAANTRLAQSQTDARLADLQQAERFSLLERAIIPEASMGGGNKKLVIAGALASLLAGLGLALALDLMFPVIRTAAQMERQLDLRPVVVIPEMKPAKPAKGRGPMKLLDDPTKPLLGLPRYAVISGAVTLALLTAAALI